MLDTPDRKMNADNHQKPKEARNRFSPRASGESRTLPTPYFWPRNTDFRLLASRTVREQILLFSATQLVVICYSSTGNSYRSPVSIFIKNLWIFRNGFLMLRKWCVYFRSFWMKAYSWNIYTFYIPSTVTNFNRNYLLHIQKWTDTLLSPIVTTCSNFDPAFLQASASVPIPLSLSVTSKDLAGGRGCSTLKVKILGYFDRNLLTNYLCLDDNKTLILLIMSCNKQSVNDRE